MADRKDTPSAMGVSHISIQVKDLERSLRFYRDVLGTVVSLETEQHFEGNEGGVELTRHRRLAYLRWEDRPGAAFLLLSEQLANPAPESRAEPVALGVDHFGVHVDDLDAILERAKTADVEIVYGPAEHPAEFFGHPGAASASVRTVMFRDPDGIVVQADQWVVA